MKLRILYTIVFINLIALAYSQNWTIFNKDYRYNYSLENESYTTVVIFADSTLIQGVDTIYSLNRIATKCDSCWFYYPEPGVADSNYIIGNQPQFLQRRIVYANNQYRLSDTSNYIIPRFLSLGNSWTFNSSRGITAQVISATIKNYFGVSDSVNTILLSTNDSIIISKQFGIVKYPAKFWQHIYYKLRGIESAASYTINSIYGEKVPNLFDFNYQKPGIIKFYWTTAASYSGFGASCNYYFYTKDSIMSYAQSASNYTITLQRTKKGCESSCINSSGCSYYTNPNLVLPATTYTKTISGSILPISPSSDFGTGIMNAYNNQLYEPKVGLDPRYYIAHFGNTTTNKFFKSYGGSCSNLTDTIRKLGNYLPHKKSLQNSNVYYYSNWSETGHTFILDYGVFDIHLPAFESEQHLCTSAIIDENDTIGNYYTSPIVTNVNEFREADAFSSFGPNPTKDLITINFPFEATGNNGTIEVKDVFGKMVFQKSIASGTSSEKINLQNCSQGIYFVDVKISHFQKQYKVIKE
jgi:hypothetical protein